MNELTEKEPAGNNAFKNALGRGEFVLLLETEPPATENRAVQAAERILPLAESIAGIPGMHGGLFINDPPDRKWSAAETAAELPAETRSRHCCAISGSGRTAENINAILKTAAAAGVTNLLPLTGDALPLSLKETQERVFTGSDAILEQIKEFLPGTFFAGTAVNPFHYQRAAITASCNRMLQKLNAGAQFVAVQAGWDMLQNQTLAWYLLRRELFFPLLARLVLLDQEKIEKIAADKLPGMRFTPEYIRMLSYECRGSRAQFEAAQYRRLALQAAGCRLLGYSGIILSGVTSHHKVAAVAAKIREGLEEFRSLDRWLQEYNSSLAGAEIRAGLEVFRFFDRFLRRDYPFDDPPAQNDENEVRFSSGEKLIHRIRKFFFTGADKHRPDRDRLLKKVLAGCRGCEACRLPQNNFFCPEHCPKKLKSGPCGGLRDDGSCELGHDECIFVKINRCERWQTKQN